MRKLLLFAFALFLSGSMMAQFNVTMVVDMSTADGFDPATNAVYISGNVWDWPEPGPDLQLMQSDTNNLVYYITAELAEPMEVQYKYFSDFVGAGWDGGEWAGDPNRVIYPVGEATLMDTWGDTPVMVTFNVDMTNVEGFDPATNTVTMAGTINIANNWQEPGNDSSLMMSPSEGNNMIWTLSKYLYTGNTYQYKFFSDVIAAGWGGGEWDGDPNREVTVSGEMTVDKVFGVKPAAELMVADFEDGTAGPLTLHVMGCGDWDNSELHPVDETFFVVDNPDMSGINATSKVMQFERRGTDDGGLPWGGFWANVDPELDLTTYKYVHVMVWKPRVSPVKFKVEGGPSGNLEIFSSNEQTETNKWVDMVFPFDTMQGTYPVLSFMPDFEDPLTSTGVTTIYFDNIRVNSDPEPYDNTGIFDGEKYVPAVTVAPNPCNNVLNMNLENDLQSLEIYNMMGQKQISFDNVSAGMFSVNTSDLPSGIYFMTVRDMQNNMGTVKFIKQ